MVGDKRIWKFVLGRSLQDLYNINNYGINYMFCLSIYYIIKHNNNNNNNNNISVTWQQCEILTVICLIQNTAHLYLWKIYSRALG